VVNREEDNGVEKQKSLKFNFVMSAVLTMSSMIFPLIKIPYVSRILLPTGTGKVSFATSLITYFNMFAQLGIPTYGVRACACVRDNKEKLSRTVQELLMINLIMGAITYVVLGVALFTVPRLFEERTLYLIISSTILLNALGIEWMYRALEQYTYITLRSVVFKFVAVIAMFVLVHKQSDYVIYGAISIFAASASNLLNFFNAHKYISIKPVGGYDLRRHLKAVGIFFAMSCATTIYTNLDTVMLGFMTNDVEVGYYNAAVKIKVILVSIVTSLGTVLLPRCSYYVEHGLIKEFRRISAKALNFVVLVSVPLVVYFILFAKDSIFFLSGDAYAGSVMPMKIIMPTLTMIGITNILGLQILVPLGKEKQVLYSEIAGAVADLVLNALLIPKFASSGAAVGTLVAEAVVLLVQMYALKDKVFEAFCKIHYLRVLLGVLAGTAVSMLAMQLPILSIFGQQQRYFVIVLVTAICFFGGYGIVLLAFKEPLAIELVSYVTNFVKKLRNRGRGEKKAR
jgi:O-antigen/teichoic acid export membrane protein